MFFPLHRTSSCRGTFPRRVRDGDPLGRRLAGVENASGSTAVVANSAATVGALGARTLALTASYGKNFLLGAVGKIISNKTSFEVEMRYDDFTDFVSNALSSEVTTFFSAGSATARYES